MDGKNIRKILSIIHFSIIKKKDIGVTFLILYFMKINQIHGHIDGLLLVLKIKD